MCLVTFGANESEATMAAPSLSLRISRHAVDRWRERVDTDCRAEQAREAVTRFVRGGRSRPTPRGWMKGVRPAPGLRFIYSANRPGVCVLAWGGTALTVLTRSLCGPGRRPCSVAGRGGKPRGLAQPSRRRDAAGWEWEEAA